MAMSNNILLKLLQMKSIMYVVKNSNGKIKNRLDITDKKISEFKNIARKVSKKKHRMKNRI